MGKVNTNEELQRAFQKKDRSHTYEVPISYSEFVIIVVHSSHTQTITCYDCSDDYIVGMYGVGKLNYILSMLGTNLKVTDMYQ